MEILDQINKRVVNRCNTE